MKRFSTILILITMLLIANGCKSRSNVSEVDSKIKTYAEDDVRNRTLKEAIRLYNNGSYKTVNFTLNKAQGERLRDEDIVVVNELRTLIDAKTDTAVKNLQSLAVEGKLFAYDFEYNSIHVNYETSSVRSMIEQSKKSYLERLHQENNGHLTQYFEIIKDLKKATKQKTSGDAVEYYTDTTALILRVVVNGYESPKLFLDLNPSQLENELETITISSTSVGLFFNKSSSQVYNYNISSNKTITFNLLEKESKLNLINFKQLLDDGNIKIETKWFYEPETKKISPKAVANMNDVLSIYKRMTEEYQLRADKIYVPKYVK